MIDVKDSRVNLKAAGSGCRAGPTVTNCWQLIKNTCLLRVLLTYSAAVWYLDRMLRRHLILYGLY